MDLGTWGTLERTIQVMSRLDLGVDVARNIRDMIIWRTGVRRGTLRSLVRKAKAKWPGRPLDATRSALVAYSICLGLIAGKAAGEEPLVMRSEHHIPLTIEIRHDLEILNHIENPTLFKDPNAPYMYENREDDPHNVLAGLGVIPRKVAEDLMAESDELWKWWGMHDWELSLEHADVEATR